MALGLLGTLEASGPRSDRPRLSRGFSRAKSRKAAPVSGTSSTWDPETSGISGIWDSEEGPGGSGSLDSSGGSTDSSDPPGLAREGRPGRFSRAKSRRAREMALGLLGTLEASGPRGNRGSTRKRFVIGAFHRSRDRITAVLWREILRKDVDPAFDGAARSRFVWLRSGALMDPDFDGAARSRMAPERSLDGSGTPTVGALEGQHTSNRWGARRRRAQGDQEFSRASRGVGGETRVFPRRSVRGET